MDLLAEQRAERKERILEAARGLIAERGYAGVTMRELAQRSRVSVPTLYNLFGGKGEVLFAAVESHFLGLLARTDEGGTRGLARVLGIVEACSREMLRMAPYSRSLLAVFAGSEETAGLNVTIARELTDGLATALDEMREDGELLAWIEPRVLAERIASHCIITSLEWLSGHVDDEGLFAATLYDTCMLLAGASDDAVAAGMRTRARRAQGQAAAVEPRKRRRDSRGGRLQPRPV